MFLLYKLMSFFFEVSHPSALRRALSTHLCFPTCMYVHHVWVSVRAHVHQEMYQCRKAKEARHNDTVKCSMSPRCTRQIIRRAFRASFFRQTQKQGRVALRVNIIIGTVWQQHQIRSCHRTGCMVMLESVVEQVCQTGESIPGEVCCFILVALYCCCNILRSENMVTPLRYRLYCSLVFIKGFNLIFTINFFSKCCSSWSILWKLQIRIFM